MDVLIYEIHKRNILWNKWNPRYRDRAVVDKEWESVARNTGFTKEEARRKWRNLRDQFAKELKKLPKRNSAELQESDITKYRGRWQYFRSLLFLKDSLLPREAEDILKDVDIQDSGVNAADEEVEENETKSDTSNISQIFSNQPQISSNSSTAETDMALGRLSEFFKSSKCENVKTEIDVPPSTPRTLLSRPLKRKEIAESKDSVEKQLLQIEAKKLAFLEQPEDDDFLFFKSLLPYFKQMHPIQKLRVRCKIQDIIIQEMTTSYQLCKDSNVPHSNTNPCINPTTCTSSTNTV